MESSTSNATRLATKGPIVAVQIGNVFPSLTEKSNGEKALGCRPSLNCPPYRKRKGSGILIYKKKKKIEDVYSIQKGIDKLTNPIE